VDPSFRAARELNDSGLDCREIGRRCFEIEDILPVKERCYGDIMVDITALFVEDLSILRQEAGRESAAPIRSAFGMGTQ
jgi:hypothetical protein